MRDVYRRHKVTTAARLSFEKPHHQRCDGRSPNFKRHSNKEYLASEYIKQVTIDNQKELLEIAVSGAKKPSTCSKIKHIAYLARALGRYTCRGHKSYHRDFDIRIRSARLDWFDRVARTKRQLIELAQSGADKPLLKSSDEEEKRLARALIKYTQLNNQCYDEEFTQTITFIRPEWIVRLTEIQQRVAAVKQKLLQMAKDGEKRPTVQSDDPQEAALGRRLSSYTKKYNNARLCSYDTAFDKEIRELRPDWFDPDRFNRVAETKKHLLEMAASGADRPKTTRRSEAEESLAGRLSSYVHKNGAAYDADFDKKLRKLRPDWFDVSYDELLVLINATKRKLLDLAMSGADRPSQRTSDLTEKRLASALNRYTCKSKVYDEAFSQAIRKIRPDWFDPDRHTRVIETKKKLLEMAASGVERPHGNSNNKEEKQLAIALSHYLRLTSDSHDADFMSEMQKIRPEWVSTSANHKRQLLEMAEAGLPRPTEATNSTLTGVLRHYICKTSRCYDAAFDEKIHKLRPDWF